MGFLASLLKKYGHPLTANVLDRMPKEWVQDALHEADVSIESLLLFPQKVISRVHPSWYVDLMEDISVSIRPVLRRALEEDSGFSPMVRQFLLYRLVKRWPSEVFVPVESFEPTAFDWLFHEKKLDEFVLILGIYGLVDFVRKIIEKKRLQMLLDRLQPLQRGFLRFLLPQVVSSTSQMNIQKWLACDRESGQRMIQQHGYQRLGWALRGESPMFLWRFFHSIEKTNACVMQQAIEQELSDEEYKLMKKQVMRVRQFFKQVEDV